MNEKIWLPANLPDAQAAILRNPVISVPVNIPLETFNVIVQPEVFRAALRGEGNKFQAHQTEAGIVIPTRLIAHDLYANLRIREQRSLPEILRNLLSVEHRAALNSSICPNPVSVDAYMLNEIPRLFRRITKPAKYAWVPYAQEDQITVLQILDQMCIPWIHADFPGMIKKAFEAEIEALRRRSPEQNGQRKKTQQAV